MFLINFFYYNNGITIVVADFEERGDNSLTLNAPQIVNGAQTSNSILDRAKRTHNFGWKHYCDYNQSR